MRYRSLALIAVVALVASSCSADPGGGSPATPAGEDPSAGSAVTGGLSVDQQELTDAMRLLMLRDEQLSAEFTDDQIGCLSEGLAGAFSDVRRDELQLDADSLTTSHNDRASFALGVAYEMTDDETLDVVAGASKCVDWRPAAAEDLVDAGVPPTEAECIASELPDPGIESMVMRTLVIGSMESAPGFGLTDDESFEATGPCLDVAGTFLDLLVGDAGISEDGARCLADGLPDWVFDTELDVDEDTANSTDEDDEEPSIEYLTELEARCLSPGELQSLSAASLDDAASSAIPLEPPAPTELETVAQESVGPSGGVVAHDGVVISVPSGALSELAEVIIREPLGEFGSEVGGAVVGVEHLNPVQVPITVTWDLSHLSDFEQRTLLLVRWDDDLGDWIPQDLDYEIRDGILTAEIQEWSWYAPDWAKTIIKTGGEAIRKGGEVIQKGGEKAWAITKKGAIWAGEKAEETWTKTKEYTNKAWIWSTDRLAELSQSVQELFGRRVAAPRCSSDPLPDWVENAGDTGIGAAAVRVCYENGVGERIRMGVANNRTFTQIIRTDADEGWTPAPLIATPAFSVEFMVQTVAHKLLSNEERLFLPALKDSHVTIARPSIGGPHYIQFWHTHNELTFLFDVGIYALSFLPDDKLPHRVQLIFEVFFECGLTQLVDFSASYDLSGMGRAIVNAMKRCATDITDPKSALGKEVRSRMALASGISEQEVSDYFKNDRTVARFSKAIKLLKIAEGIGILVDLAAETAVDTLRWGVAVRGRAAALGDWDPTCSDIAGDSNRLFKNLVFQDVFGGSFEVHEVDLFDAWKRSSERAVAPLRACDVDYRSTLAEDVLSWGLDSEANRIVGDHILALSGSPSGGPLSNSAVTSSYIAIAAGGGHVCGILSEGNVQCWGDNTYGQADAPSARFSVISADWDHSCGIRSDGTVECWGNNASGQADPPSGRFVAISDGGYHSCGLREDSSVECWGSSAFGRVDAPSGRFAAVSAGGDHSCGIRHGGAVECWGYDGLGQIDAPTNQFMEVSSGWSHSCGMRSDGTVECWGDNSFGRTDAPSGQFTAISAGSEHSCGMRSDGTVECWGDNSFGRTDAPSGQFTAISAGLDQSCGIRDDGAVECWGYDGDR